MKADALKLLIKIAERRERLSAMTVASRRRAVDDAAQLRAQAQLRMERASFKAESERMNQARAGMPGQPGAEAAEVSAQRLREGHEYGYLLLWKALGEFSEVRKADVALAEKRSDLAQATQIHREMIRRRQKLEAMYEKLMSQSAVLSLEGET